MEELKGKTIKDVTFEKDRYKLDFSDGTSYTLGLDDTDSTPYAFKFKPNVEKLESKFDVHDLIKRLNDATEDEDAMYGWDITLDSVDTGEKEIVIWFDIEYGHFIRGNKVTVHTNGKIDVHLEEPFDSCGADGPVRTVAEEWAKAQTAYFKE